MADNQTINLVLLLLFLSRNKNGWSIQLIVVVTAIFGAALNTNGTERPGQQNINSSLSFFPVQVCLLLLMVTFLTRNAFRHATLNSLWKVKLPSSTSPIPPSSPRHAPPRPHPPWPRAKTKLESHSTIIHYFSWYGFCSLGSWSLLSRF